jgi:hypothetical protein
LLIDRIRYRLTTKRTQTFEEYGWLDDDTIIAPVVPLGRPPAPSRPATPRGPRVQSSTAGVAAQARTYTDLLRDSHDAALFSHFCTSVLLRVPIAAAGAAPAAPLGAGATPRLYSRVDPSPDGRYLIVEYLEPPFSYLVPCSRFPKRVELWRASDGALLRELAALPLAESIPIVNDSCRVGVRGVSWRADADATLYWAEAQDGGDPRVAAEPRDIVYALNVAAADTGAAAAAAVAAAAPVELLRTAWRYGGVSWGDGALALAYESQYKSRTARTWAFAPDAVLRNAASSPPAPMRLFQERSYEDAYSDPGAPVTRRTPTGSYVLAIVEPEGATPSGAPASPASGERPGRRLLFQGSGAGPEGNRPFMDLFDVDAAAPVTRLFECTGPQLEYPSAIVSDAGGAPITLAGLRMLLTRETPTDVPQYFIVSWDAGALPAGGGGEAARPRREVQISDFPHPHPQLVAPPKQLIRYKRADGLDLSATLYTPPGWTAGVDPPLPCLVWCAPQNALARCAFGQRCVAYALLLLFAPHAGRIPRSSKPRRRRGSCATARTASRPSRRCLRWCGWRAATPCWTAPPCPSARRRASRRASPTTRTWSSWWRAPPPPWRRGCASAPWTRAASPSAAAPTAHS